jgi:hypothetical protein
LLKTLNFSGYTPGILCGDLKRRYSLNALPFRDLAGPKKTLKAPNKLSVSDYHQSRNVLIPALDLAVKRETKKNLVHVERKTHNNSLELGKPKKAAVEPYEVGEYSEMIKRSKTDKLDIHHAPQKHAAKQIIPGYNESKGPSIVVPEHLHRKIKNTKGTYDDNPRQLLAKTAQDLRNHTDAPNSAIQELVKKAKNDFPGTFDK